MAASTNERRPLGTGDHLQTRRRQELEAECRRDLEAVNAFIAEHGSFAELVRQHYRDSAGAGLSPLAGLAFFRGQTAAAAGTS